jgi:hypothetical protein
MVESQNQNVQEVLMKKLIAALAMASFLFAGAFGVAGAAESQSEGGAAVGAPTSDQQQQTPRKHHSHKGKHHKKQQKQTQGAGDLGK